MTATAPTWQLKMLFDGKCPLCSAEVAMLQKRNDRGLIAFQDISDPAFQPGDYGIAMEDVVGAIHAVRPDGTVIRGVDVFAEVYEAVGWRWLAAPIRWRLTRPLVNLAYRAFAAVRPRLSRFKPKTCDQTCRMPQV